jgi:uncharacterized membrane protein (UPF0182 family)
MRVPNAGERRRTYRFRAFAVGAVVLLLVVLFSLRGLASFYTDYLWFDSLGQGGTWSRLLSARIVPALVFTIAFFVIVLGNLLVADRLKPQYRATGPEDELLARYNQVTAPYHRRILVGVGVFFALIAGVGVSAQWRQWILFTHRVDFGVKDPQFHKDIGFYVFQLPFLQFIAQWLFAWLVIVLILTAVEHYANGGIRFQSPFQRVTPQVKAHLSVILAVMALVKTAQYYLGRYELDFSSRGVVNGASYTDVKAQLPALNLLIFISVVAAALFLWNIRRRGWVLPIIAVGLWGFVSLVVGAIYPALIQQFKVGPNEYQAESKYISRNINATRSAFRLDQVKTQSFDFKSFNDVDQAAEVVNANLPTIDNARLWDPNVTLDTYGTLQALQTYYKVSDVDVDRYVVDNQVRQVLVSARGLNSDQLPSQSFVNRHIVYTHGYGLISSLANAATPDGSPQFLLRDVPINSNGISLDAGHAAQIYFGEGLDSYVLVHAKSKEFNYQTGGSKDNVTRYEGKDGIKLSNVFRKAAFALRFGDFNTLISGQVTSDTKILMERDIMARVRKLAPFLSYDADPYPVTLGDRTVFVIDAYTTTNRYPYAQSTSGTGGLSKRFNYVRNSVKVTVDAYDGTVRFYVVDAHDPLVRAYRKAFPDLFRDGKTMPANLRAHLRYPEDLFRVQASIYGRYHVTQSRRFYDGSAKWLVSPDPGSGAVTDTGVVDTQASSSARPNQGANSTGRRIDPYYLYIRLPGDNRESFVIVEPFVPVSSGNSQTRLVSFLTAKSDPGEYGTMQSFTMPQGSTVLGPVQVSNEINRTTAISQQITLLNKEGSEVIEGSLQLIPVGSSIIYVRPIYVRGRGQGGYPKFQFVAVFTQDKTAVLASTVNDALQQLFGAASAPAPSTTTTPGSSAPTTTTPGGTVATVGDLLKRASDLLAQANTALRTGDLATYQADVNQAQSLVDQALQLAGGSPATTTTTRPNR